MRPTPPAEWGLEDWDLLAWQNNQIETFKMLRTYGFFNLPEMSDTLNTLRDAKVVYVFQYNNQSNETNSLHHIPRARDWSMRQDTN